MHYWRLFLLTLFSASFFAPELGAQDFPYALDTKREIKLLATGGTLLATGYYLETRLDELPLSTLETQAGDNLFSLDRGAIRQQSEQYRVLSDDLLRGSLLLPLTLLANRGVRSKPLTLGLMGLETIMLTEGTTKFLKTIIRRRRPLTYNPAFSVEERRDHNGRQSFPSGHTSNTAALTFFTAKVFHDLYPESKLRPVVWGVAAAVPALTGYARYRAGKHFPTDILAGYALGATLGILVPQWHKDGGKRKVTVLPTGDGIGMVLRL